MFKENPSFDILKAQYALTSTDNKDYKKVSNIFHSQSIIKKEYIEKTEYPLISVAEDIEFERKARIKLVEIYPNYWYIYRWGLNIHHVSGIRDEKESWNKSLYFYNDSGNITINPELKNDYWKDVKENMDKGKL